MSLRKKAKLRVFDDDTSQWVFASPNTDASTVETSDGSNVQEKLDGISTQISDAVDTSEAKLKGGVGTGGDTLKKLYDLITALESVIGSDDLTLDTVQEIVDFIKANKDALDSLGTYKIDIEDIVNDLATVATVEGKVLDARQGKVLKDLIDGLSDALATLETQNESFVTENDLTTAKAEILSQAASAAILLARSTPPENPVDGQIWFELVETTEL